MFLGEFFSRNGSENTETQNCADKSTHANDESQPEELIRIH